MRTKKRSAEQLLQTERSRGNVRRFLHQFHAREMWTIDGPMMTDVDELMCFALWHPCGDSMGSHPPMGICIVQTWLSGGWEIYLPSTDSGEIDETARAIVRNRASKQMLDALYQIDAMPFTSKNDSEQLRHTIKTMQKIARDASVQAGSVANVL